MNAIGTYTAPTMNSCVPSPSLPYLKRRLILPFEIGDGDPQHGCQTTKPDALCPSTPAEKWIELSWAVMGDRLPADHNYRLYSALVERIPNLKEQEWHLKTINGIPDRKGWVKLGRESRLGIRCDLTLLEQFGTLDNQILRVGQNLIQLGTLEGRSLSIKKTLRARIVTIKQAGVETPEKTLFAVALGKQMCDLGIRHMPIVGKRCTLRIKETTVVGFEVRFPDLSYRESLLLQRYGLGGKHRMGCGVFW